jgi:hypothetical protein
LGGGVRLCEILLQRSDLLLVALIQLGQSTGQLAVIDK